MPSHKGFAKDLRKLRKKMEHLADSERKCAEESEENNKMAEEMSGELFKYMDKQYAKLKGKSKAKGMMSRTFTEMGRRLGAVSSKQVSLDTNSFIDCVLAIGELYCVILLAISLKGALKSGEVDEEDLEGVDDELQEVLTESTLGKITEEKTVGDDAEEVFQKLAKMVKDQKNEIDELLKHKLIKFLEKAVEENMPDEAKEAVHVNIKSAGGFTEKIMFRHPVLTDLVRGMFVVPDEDYVEFVEMLLGNLPGNVFLKKGMGTRNEWPYPFFMVKLNMGDLPALQLLDSLMVEFQVVPEFAFKNKAKSHAKIEETRADAMKRKLSKYNMDVDELEEMFEHVLKNLDIFADGVLPSDDEDADEDADEDTD